MTVNLTFEQRSLGLTAHSLKRVRQRGFTQEDVASVLRFGRRNFQNGAVYYSIGRKEIKRYKKIYPSIQHMDGMHVVSAPNGSIVTVLRNRDFKIIKR